MDIVPAVFPRTPFHWRRRAALTALLLSAFVMASSAAERPLELFWVDSEGGGSTLIVTPAGESILIDSGNPGGRDAGRIHRVATEVAGLRRIDHLIVTHLHVDHFGGAAELAALMPVGEVWDNGVSEKDPDGNPGSTWLLTSKAYRGMTAKRHVVQPGTTLPLKPGAVPVELRCHISRQSPWTDGARSRRPAVVSTNPVPAKAPDPSDNANSSAWVLSLGSFRFYDGGDLTWNVEARLVNPEVLVPEVDVYQVTHHGLDVSNHPLLVQALNPTVSVMNNGPTKGGMGEVLATLRGLPALQAQYQVHKNVRPDGVTNNCPDAFIANVKSDCAGDFVRCTVAADGSSYTFSIPANGHRQTYVTRRKS